MAHVSAKEIIKVKCTLFGQMFESGQIAEMVALFYTPDAVLEGQNLPPQRGRAAIAAVFEEATRFYRTITIEHEPPVVYGEIAFGSISNTNVLMDGSMELHRGLMIWKLVDESWFVERDCFFGMETAILSGDAI